MNRNCSLDLVSTNVIITANVHNPSILNKDFLVNNNIVPEEWTTEDFVNTPLLSHIKYDNGVSWLMDSQRLVISKECNMPFHEYDDSVIYDLAGSYVKILPHTQYANLWFNYSIRATHHDPHRWFSERFLKPGPWNDDGLFLVPGFTMRMDKADLNIYFRIPPNAEAGSYMINCNIHHAGPFESDLPIRDKLLEWTDYKVVIISKLDRLLGGL